MEFKSSTLWLHSGTVHHRGKDNHNADVLSRYDCSDKNNSSQRNPEIFEQVEKGQTSLIPEKGEECQRENDFIYNCRNLSES